MKAAIEIPLVDLDNVQAGDGKAGGSQGSWKDGAQVRLRTIFLNHFGNAPFLTATLRVIRSGLR